jgi:hypothetical protein
MGLNKFVLPLIKKRYPPISSVLCGNIPGPAEIAGALKLWFSENFPKLRVHDGIYEHEFTVATDNRVALANCWLGRFQFYNYYFDYSDPMFFDDLQKSVEEFFCPFRAR